MIRTKRIYDTVSRDDGYRILVDRLWPRGVSKEKAHVDLWMREVGPSDDLRKWFAHDPRKWEEFKKKYEAELNGNPDLIAKIRKLEKDKGLITLVYSAKDAEHNQAVALSLFLRKG